MNEKTCTRLCKPIRVDLREAISFEPKRQGCGRLKGAIQALIASLLGQRVLVDYKRFHDFARNYELKVNERIVELPFALRELNHPNGSKGLEFGCATSRLSLELASAGFQVTGIDLDDYYFTHPNLKFIQGDFLKSNLKENYFDAVVSVSAIEHCGLKYYGDDAAEDGDRQVVEKIWRILRKGGKLIMTVPFGKPGVRKGKYRVYDAKMLEKLLNGFKVIKQEFYVCTSDKYWQPADEGAAARTDSLTTDAIQAVVCVVAEKP